MGEATKIQWAHHTFNPWIGCAKVSPGCAHCYAEQATPTRVARARGLELWGKDAARRPASEAMWREPLKWNREAERAGARARVFCASLADVFEDRVDLDEARARLFGVIAATPHLDWLLLTKRPRAVSAVLQRAAQLLAERDTSPDPAFSLVDSWCLGGPPPNVWLGATAESQQHLEERGRALFAVPARVHFLSCEPLLGPLDFGRIDNVELGLDWVIVGGESGPAARPCDVGWVRSIVEQCKAARIACFVKQLGAAPGVRTTAFPLGTDLELQDRKGGDPAEWPEDLRVREVPR